ncbi:MAG: hypothetical protein ABFE07_13260 [Armatimonadia bacterium]
MLTENTTAIRHQLDLHKNLMAMLQPDQRDVLREMAEHGVFEQLQHDALENAVTAFEACWRQVTHLASNPSDDPEMAAQIAAQVRNSYQSVERGRRLAQDKIGIDIFAPLTPDELVFVDRMFEARHVITHNSGIIDTKYMAKCGLPGSTAGQRLQLQRDDLMALLQLIEKMAAEAGHQLSLPARNRPASAEEMTKMSDPEAVRRRERKRELRERVLRFFYTAQHTPDGEVMVQFADLAKELDVPEDELDKALDYMQERGWIERQMGNGVEATWEGIWYAEEVGAADETICRRNKDIRDRILTACGVLSGYSTQTWLSLEEIIEQARVSEAELGGSIQYLADYSGMIVSQGGHRYSLTADGEDALDGLD